MKDKLLSVAFWRNRLVEVAVAMTTVYVLTAYLDQREADKRAAVPPEDWFVVEELFIPDHEVGSDPQIVYARQIRQPFRGFWVAEAQRRDDSERATGFFTQCTGSGTNDYELTDILPNDRVSWSWFFDRPCVIPPGTYRVVVSYDMMRADYPVKRQEARSNVFRVYERGQLPGVAP